MVFAHGRHAPSRAMNLLGMFPQHNACFCAKSGHDSAESCHWPTSTLPKHFVAGVTYQKGRKQDRDGYAYSHVWLWMKATTIQFCRLTFLKTPISTRRAINVRTYLFLLSLHVLSICMYRTGGRGSCAETKH